MWSTISGIYQVFLTVNTGKLENLHVFLRTGDKALRTMFCPLKHSEMHICSSAIQLPYNIHLEMVCLLLYLLNWLYSDLYCSWTEKTIRSHSCFNSVLHRDVIKGDRTDVRCSQRMSQVYLYLRVSHDI